MKESKIFLDFFKFNEQKLFACMLCTISMPGACRDREDVGSQGTGVRDGCELPCQC